MEEDCSRGAVRTAGREVLCLKARGPEDISIPSSSDSTSTPATAQGPSWGHGSEEGQGNGFWGLALGREQASTRKEGLAGTGVQ